MNTTIICSDSESEFDGFDSEVINNDRQSNSSGSLAMSDVSDVSDVSSSDADASSDAETETGNSSSSKQVPVNFALANDDQWLKRFTERHGPLILDEDSTEYQIFSYFFSSELMDMLVRETNRYAADHISRSDLKPNARAHRWTGINESDMNGFLAIIILQSIVRMPTYELY